MSLAHIIVIAVIALVVLGPEKLPQVARTLGKAMAEFRRITGDFRATVEGEMRELERVTAIKDLREQFPSHVHYDVQQAQEAETARAAASGPTVLPPAFTGDDHTIHAPAQPDAPIETGTDEAKAAVASGKPSDGKPTSS
jgi:Tat protein translocase TatB subunit